MTDRDALLDDAFRARFMRRMGDAIQHDLRSPLQGLGLCIDLVQRSAQPLAADDPSRASIEKAVGMARRELERLERTARGLMSDAGILQDEVTRFDLVPLVREAAHHFVIETAMRGVQFVVTLPDAPVHVSGPRAEIGRALVVCIGAAVDAAPDAGRIELALRRDGDHAVVEVLGAVAGAGPAGDSQSFAAMGLRYARACVEACDGQFISGNGSTSLRFPLAA